MTHIVNKDMEQPLWTSITEVASDLSPILVVIGSIIAIVSLCIRFYQIHKDHKRSRVVLAIQSVNEFCNSANESTTTARAFIEKLDENNCEKILKTIPFEVDASNKGILGYALHAVEPDISKLEVADNKLYLKEKHIGHLRFLALQHLNSIEIALLHWKEETGERRIFEEQLGYLVCSNGNRFILSTFRSIYRELGSSDREPFPCIDAFVEKMKCSG
ncbi:TPA: hypothetical protein I7264_07210 [Vibrio parahaemolyticus]|uniref:hypothetical protein n=1 Tax=Vibrio parahaemolyticus TaxID=670 RepID=UPI00186AAEE7|nr:hypothetical protein [Vibrio parahaemolyticus]EHV5548211.1 hypothetical protein [Vibrio parahaemolyticus]EIK4764568.1 hypothetical protein [Vibrio parahaemolyticus]EJE4677033.1 hypothetical protein [Vibrio parahaemolyticus]EJG1569955.1 hypothetical protein [Vibrio parahaemolyticus]EKB1988325.1 hypothetical protein [Vibrio parahaemolyticus]